MSEIKNSSVITFKKFSLIELLVVISVFAILASLFSPSLNNAKKQVQAQECRNNLSNIYNAILIYVDDNDSILMGPTWGAQRPHIKHRKGWKYSHFPRYLEDYMSEFTLVGEDQSTYNKAFVCPANAELEMQGYEQVQHRSHYRGTINGWIDGGPIFGRPAFRGRPALVPKSIYVIPNPTSREIMVDSDLDNTNWLDDKNWDHSTVPVHEGKYRNNLFFDGSVKTIEWVP